MTRDPRFPDEVDFVVGPGDDGWSGEDPIDEELPAAARHAHLGRARRPLIVLAALAVGALVVIRVADGGSDRSPTALGSTSVAPSGVPASSGSIAADGGVSQVVPTINGAPGATGSRLAIRHDKGTVIFIPVAGSVPGSATGPGPACSSTALCRTSDAVPAAVRRALRARYGDITVDSVTSLLTGPSTSRLQLRTRTVQAHTPAQTVLVSIHPIVGTDRPQIVFADSGAGVSVSVTVANQPWTITVTARTPRTRDPDTNTPTALAIDPRLLAVH